MRSGARYLIAELAAFFVVIVMFLPAQWAERALPPGLSCQQLEGTLWSGTCVGLSARGEAFGDVGWKLHPLRLLLGTIAADLDWTRAGDRARGFVIMRTRGRLSGRDIHAQAHLPSDLLRALPAGWTGNLQGNLGLLEWDGRRVSAIEGEIDLRDLTGEGSQIGSYRVRFPPGNATTNGPVGQITDLGGVLELSGTLHLTPEPGWLIEGPARPRPGAPSALTNALRLYGPPDARGAYAVSAQGTF
jgi:Type II secretion system (T2SS), protein N